MPKQGPIERFMAGTGRAARVLLKANAVPPALQGVARVLSAFGGYEAAKPNRTREDWTTKSVGPNATVAAASTNLVARSRDLQKNDAHWAKFLQVLCDDVVGTGIVPRAVHPKSLDADAKPKKRTRAQRQADAAWEWLCGSGVADIEGRQTLYALTWIACMSWGRDGSVFVRRVWDIDPSRLVPVRFQVLERDMLDTTRNNETTTSGARVVNGIQVGANGRVEGYWFRKSHPGEVAFAYGASVFVPAADVVHLFIPLRAGQLDGIPFGAPSMVRKRDLGSYENAELTRKDIEALTVAIVTPPPIAEALGSLEVDDETSELIGLTPTVVNAKGQAVADMHPGGVYVVENGGAVNYLQPHATAYYPEYKKAMLREIAMGLNMTYEDMAGDLEGVNYTSYRAGHIKRDAHIDGLQWLWFVPTLCDRLWDWCQEGAYLRGNVSTPSMPRAWAPPKRVSVDPMQDAVADIVEERAGYALHDDKLATRGHDPATFYERKRDENKVIDDNELTFDSDPRKYAFRGAFPPATQGTALDDGTDAGKNGGEANGAKLQALSDLLGPMLAAIDRRNPGFAARLLKKFAGQAPLAPAPDVGAKAGA